MPLLSNGTITTTTKRKGISQIPIQVSRRKN
jgi:hypothetical protein